MEFFTPNISLLTLIAIKYAIEERLNKEVDLIHAPLDEKSLIKPLKVIDIYEHQCR